MSTRIIALLLLFTSVGMLPAQVVYDVTLSAPGAATPVAAMNGLNHPSLLYPAGAIQPGGPLPLTNFPAATAAVGGGGVFFFGGAAIDGGTGSLYATDGFTELTVEGHPTYPGLGVAAATTPLAPLLAASGLADVTGMCCDVAGRLLWMCDTVGNVAAFNLAAFPPTYVAGSTIVVPGNPVVDIMVGLGWEPSTGTLWSTTSSGAIHNFTTAGVAVGAQPVLNVPGVAPFTLSGLSVNTTNGPGAFVPFTGSYHICVSDGANLYDASGTGAAPIPMTPTPIGSVSVGLAAGSGDLQFLANSPFAFGTGQVTVSLGAGFTIGTSINAPALGAGNPGLTPPLTATITGVPVGTPSALILDLTPAIPGATIGALNGDILFVNPFSPTVAIVPVNGAQTLPIPALQTAGAGVSLVGQAFAADPFNGPWGITFGPLFLVNVAAP